MSAIPATFRAYVAERATDAHPPRVDRGVRAFRESDLPEGEVEIRVGWSSVNYKDGLATLADGKVARISPLIPGIDLAGEVVSIDRLRHRDRHRRCWPTATTWASPATAGSREYARVPAGWVVPLPPGLGAARRDGDRHGRVHGRDVGRRPREPRPRAGRRSGARDRRARAASAGQRWRSSPIGATRSGRRPGSRTSADRLRALGAAGILGRGEVTGEGRPLESERWAGAVDAVGAATLPYVLRTLRTGAAVAASGNAGGASLTTTVFPFILRGVALLGMDSVNVPIGRRRALWDRLATDLRPRDLGLHATEVTLDTHRAGARRRSWPAAARGRWIVRIGG